jgi:hypothetical protein
LPSESYHLNPNALFVSWKSLSCLQKIIRLEFAINETLPSESYHSNPNALFVRWKSLSCLQKIIRLEFVIIQSSMGCISAGLEEASLSSENIKA